MPLPAALGLVRVLPFCVVRAREPALCLGVWLLGFPDVVFAVTPIPAIAPLRRNTRVPGKLS